MKNILNEVRGIAEDKNLKIICSIEGKLLNMTNDYPENYYTLERSEKNIYYIYEISRDKKKFIEVRIKKKL